MNRSGEGGCLCTIPELRGAFCLSPSHIVLHTHGLSVVVYILSAHGVLRMFYREKCILREAFQKKTMHDHGARPFDVLFDLVC